MYYWLMKGDEIGHGIGRSAEWAGMKMQSV